MPDVWTRYPDLVRDLLKEGGFTCGVAPRVLKDRDPAWTCIIDGKAIGGDLYIHPIGLGAYGAWMLPIILILAALVFVQWRSIKRLSRPS
jgi:hypothetical protein